METLDAELVRDDSRRDGRGRRLMPPEQVEAILSEYDASGLSGAAFARTVGVKYPTFVGWLKRRAPRGGARGTSPLAEVRFVEARLPSSCGEGLSVTLPDGVVARGTDPVALAALIRALRS